MRRRRPVLGAISLDLFAVLFGGATALLPVYAADVLHVGPSGFGWLRAAPGVGAAVTGAVLSVLPVTRQVGRWMFGGVVVFGVATLVFGVSTTFWISLLALTLLGAGDMVSVYIRHLLVQLETPDEIRGRVSAVNGVFIGASNELGEFESGVVAAWFGAVPAVLIGGTATLLVALVWARAVSRAVAHGPLPRRIVTTVYPYSILEPCVGRIASMCEKGRGAVNEPGRPLREHHARAGRRRLGQPG